MGVTYASYLRLGELLDLQRPREGELEHDETLFVVIHQVYELWFKQLLHELDHLQGLLRGGDAPRAQHTLKRVLTILKVLVAQIDILETMTPLGFLAFRERLEAGSGFQSYQFRELECVLGAKRPGLLAPFAEGSAERERVERRYREPGLWDAFLAYLHGLALPVPRALLERDVTRSPEPSPELQRVLIDVYRREPVAAAVCERLIDLDEGFMEWRYRHVVMVQRTIGTRLGTGGSSGAEYLRSTLHRPVFPDLWAIRTEL